jgi:hypothetical protein
VLNYLKVNSEEGGSAVVMCRQAVGTALRVAGCGSPRMAECSKQFGQTSRCLSAEE